MCLLSLSDMSDSASLWTVAPHSYLSLRFPRQEYWNALPCPSPGDLPDPGAEPISLTSPALAGSLILVPPGKLLFRWESTFVACRLSADWERPITLGRAIGFSQSFDLSVKLIQKHLHRNTQQNIWTNIWAPHGPNWHVKLIFMVTKIFCHKLKIFFNEHLC